MKLELRAWLQDLVSCAGKNGSERGGWLIVKCGQMKVDKGLSCFIHDGKNQMMALILKEALTEYENKRSLPWDSKLSHKICCLKYELRNCKMNIFEPYLCILSLDSLGQCGSAELFKPLPFVKNSQLWTLETCREAFENFNRESNEKLKDIDMITKEFHDPAEQIEWGDTPLPVSQDNFYPTQLVSQGCESFSTKFFWGETPSSNIDAKDRTEMNSEEVCRKNESGGSSHGSNFAGCKHNPLKTCYLCLLKKTKVPKALYEAAKRQNFECSCK